MVIITSTCQELTLWIHPYCHLCMTNLQLSVIKKHCVAGSNLQQTGEKIFRRRVNVMTMFIKSFEHDGLYICNTSSEESVSDFLESF